MSTGEQIDGRGPLIKFPHQMRPAPQDRIEAVVGVPTCRRMRVDDRQHVRGTCFVLAGEAAARERVAPEDRA